MDPKPAVGRYLDPMAEVRQVAEGSRACGLAASGDNASYRDTRGRGRPADVDYADRRSINPVQFAFVL
jgi:hypothetical protein